MPIQTIYENIQKSANNLSSSCPDGEYAQVHIFPLPPVPRKADCFGQSLAKGGELR
jgi:hypothetical protein